MATKYSVGSFIRLFSKYPRERWICGALVKGKPKKPSCKPKACALGIAGAYYYDGKKLVAAKPRREEALKKLFNKELLDVISINDDQTTFGESFRAFKHPKDRILGALTYIQKRAKARRTLTQAPRIIEKAQAALTKAHETLGL